MRHSVLCCSFRLRNASSQSPTCAHARETEGEKGERQGGLKGGERGGSVQEVEKACAHTQHATIAIVSAQNITHDNSLRYPVPPD